MLVTDEQVDRVITIANVMIDTICFLGITITVILFAWYYINTDRQIRFYNHVKAIKTNQELICKPLILNNEHLLYACSDK